MYNRSASSRASIWSFLFPCLAFFRGSHTTSFVTCGFSRSYNQVAQVPSSKVTCNSPRRPWIKSRMTFALVSITHSITSFPESFLTAIEILSLCTSIPIYLVPVIKGCSFLEGFEPNTQNLTPKGRPFYIASCRLTGEVPPVPTLLNYEMTASIAFCNNQLVPDPPSQFIQPLPQNSSEDTAMPQKSTRES